MTRLGWVVVAVALGACGKKQPVEAPSLDVAGVNAAVPAALKSKVVFEAREVTVERGDHRFTFEVAAPRDWNQSQEGLGILRGPTPTSFEVDSNCEGACESKDWAATVDTFFGEKYKDASSRKKDVKGEASRLIVYDNGTAMSVERAFWVDGASQYYTCGATLYEDMRELAPAVEKACESVGVKPL